jgi:hypothetical protein
MRYDQRQAHRFFDVEAEPDSPFRRLTTSAFLATVRN